MQTDSGAPADEPFAFEVMQAEDFIWWPADCSDELPASA
jgi:hypothetical protein